MKAPRLKDTMRATVLAIALGVAGAAKPVSGMNPESVEPWGDASGSSGSRKAAVPPGAGESRCPTVDIRFGVCTCVHLLCIRI